MTLSTAVFLSSDPSSQSNAAHTLRFISPFRNKVYTSDPANV
ncbi:hypothetical protein Hanom_Chr04g00284231 [Helianthus anomalus]